MTPADVQKLKTGKIHKRDPNDGIRCGATWTLTTRTRENWQNVDCAGCLKLKRSWTPTKPPKPKASKPKKTSKKSKRSATRSSSRAR